MKVKSESEVAQSCPTLSDPMDCSLLGSSIHGIFQARVLEWGAIAFSEWLKQLSNIAADGDCSHEIKRRLLLGRKSMTNLDSILKSRDITLPTKFRIVKAMVSPVIMYGHESWMVKNAECRRIDAFELWCWRRLVRVPWTARRSKQYRKGNQSCIFIERTDAEAEAPKLWPPDVKNQLTGKDPDAGKH